MEILKTRVFEETSELTFEIYRYKFNGLKKAL